MCTTVSAGDQFRSDGVARSTRASGRLEAAEPWPGCGRLVVRPRTQRRSSVCLLLMPAKVFCGIWTAAVGRANPSLAATASTRTDPYNPDTQR